MSEYKLDMSKYTIEEQPRMWADAEYREAFQSLYFEYHKLKRERDQHKAENEELKHQWDYLYKSLASLQEDYNDLEQQYDQLFRRYEMLNELI